ncbi:MAG: ribosome silencing factor [Chlamydiales bacterium]|nr:ribosome silencing factor [Chlamydiales bacterium]
MTKDPQSLVQLVGQAIYDKKGLNPLALNVQSISTLTDYIVIAEGSVDRHVVAIAKSVMDVMEEEQEALLHVEGLTNGDWVVIDYGNIIVHIFTPALRQRYQLERLWSEAAIIDLQIECKSEGCYG